MGAGSKPLRPWQVCAGDVIGSGKRVEYVFERYGELYINASDEELVRQGKRTYGEELTRLYDLDLSAVGVRPREDARITDTMNLFTWFMGRRYKLVDAADHIGYEWTGRAHGSLADALATLAVQRWLEQWLVAE